MSANLSVAVPASNGLNSSFIVSRAGKTVGVRYCGNRSAKEIKEALKASGEKGKELTRKVNEALRSEVASRKVFLAAVIANFESEGMIFDTADKRKSSGVIRFAKAAKDDTELELEAAKLELEAAKKASDAQAAEIAGFKAALAALQTNGGAVSLQAAA